MSQPTRFPADYVERVYAGVLGKMIGVYLGRPFEGWSYEKFMTELGEITGYVHEQLGVPLIVTDDDLSGTFTFVRALSDYGNPRDLTAVQIGQTWLNYIIEKRTILWWGGLGNSTEETAFRRLTHGIAAPRSGSIELNGKVVAEQIGAQIFIDAWAMLAPGNPALAADLARKAASVSHDGEAIYGAQMIAVMEALAFVERDINKLLDSALSYIPQEAIIAQMIRDIREWHANEPDWRKARTLLAAKYGYDTYGGNCHMVPNHGLIILALLYGNDDFARSLMIVNTCGWDTDCNSGNVGCLLGIKNGLRALDESTVDWRGPVADRLYQATAEGGRAITDAVQETYHLVASAYTLAGQNFVAPKQGARFNFALPGSVQGFQLEESQKSSAAPTRLENVEDHSLTGERSLAIHYSHLSEHHRVHVATPTFMPPEALHMDGYQLVASPTLYPGQQVHARVLADEQNAAAVTCQLFLRYYGADDKLLVLGGPAASIVAGQAHEFEWRIPALVGAPIAAIGCELRASQTHSGSVYLDFLTWDGAPEVVLGKPEHNGTLWRRAWVNGIDQFEPGWPETYRLIQNEGRGLLIQGTRDWKDYSVSATLTPHMAKAIGLAARAQGMRRYYALLLTDEHSARLIKVLDGEEVLAELPLKRDLYQPYAFVLRVRGTRIQGWINGRLIGDVEDVSLLTGGAVALIIEEGRVASEAVTIQPA
ncbi:ADP-ribosylglycohydrolase family protein [Ktedonosporobacter rubrisoli]|uniref:ADP-ribosylglycohydrolase family protein n=1 Tax=Ktedonosporobacter rubrisoli TaxID=2509675 RepID=A0A4P6JPQ4_KTERU|nr:ADP-ribosylglycohydrolase family protein [Ktedonosporobacter rubrisoli]QBD77367.1 ADP-ribosylglycohydrolase family protein [Ktedonosporobacter rubrisoli]